MVTWSVVRGFGKVKYFNISYAILLIVPILLELYHKASTASEFIGKTLVFPVTLRWLYAASLFYAIAIALYQYFCPSIIKRFASSEDYVNNNYEIFLRSHPQHRLNVVLTHLDPEIDFEVQSKIQELLSRKDNALGADRLAAQQELDLLVSSLHADAVQKFLVKEYNSKNMQFPIVLTGSFIFYLLGTLVLLGLLICRSLHVLFLI